jgi:hypothetical protein
MLKNITNRRGATELNGFKVVIVGIDYSIAVNKKYQFAGLLKSRIKLFGRNVIRLYLVVWIEFGLYFYINLLVGFDKLN